MIELLRKMEKYAKAVAKIFEERGKEADAEFYRGEASGLRSAIYMLESEEFALNQAKIFEDYEAD